MSASLAPILLPIVLRLLQRRLPRLGVDIFALTTCTRVSPVNFRHSSTPSWLLAQFGVVLPLQAAFSYSFDDHYDTRLSPEAWPR